jgi:two-component system response regulator AtoC
MGTRVVVYEPSPEARQRMLEALGELGFRVEAPTTEVELSVAARLGCDVAILDARGKDHAGRPAIRAVLEAAPWAEVVAISSPGEVNSAVSALREGAATVLERPVNIEGLAEYVVQSVGRVAERRRSSLRVGGGRASGFDRLVGDSPGLVRVRETLRRAAQGPALPVLLAGEAGTGKLLAARLLHDNGSRAGQEIRRFSCVGLSAAEVEVRLFGRGYPDRMGTLVSSGILATAHQSTVVLQHVEHLPLSVQTKLEAFMDTGRFVPPGGEAPVYSDVHLVATTRDDLLRRVDAGEFRRDLYYRLQVLPVGMPPLRSRGQDIRLLLSHFISTFNLHLGLAVRSASRAVVDHLQGHGWPGNVRELRNVVQEAMVSRKLGMLELEDLSVAVNAPAPAPPFTLPTAGVDLQELERRLIIQALHRTRGNQTQAAKLLGLNRDQMRYRVEKFNLRRP